MKFGAAIDQVRRAMACRPAFEELKRQIGIRDEIVTPSAYPELRSHWAVLTHGDGGNSSQAISASQFPMGLYGVRSVSEISWRCNQARAVLASTTGVRTHPNSWFAAELGESSV